MVKIDKKGKSASFRLAPCPNNQGKLLGNLSKTLKKTKKKSSDDEHLIEPIVNTPYKLVKLVKPVKPSKIQ